jgi:cyclopropane-fatty-acyl-phospholipid synthase
VRALGVTLSPSQFELARSRVAEAGLQGQVEVRCVDYRDIRDAQFERIASIGMFEHVGRGRLHEYFAHVHRLLPPGGLFLNHGIGGRPPPAKPLARLAKRVLEPVLVGGSTFRDRYVFPGGGLVPVTEAGLAAERAGFEVRDVENLREHYARTLGLWYRRLETRGEEARRLAGERTFRLWRLYLGIAAWQFAAGEFGVYQTLLEKPAGGPSRLPLTRADLYA